MEEILSFVKENNGILILAVICISGFTLLLLLFYTWRTGRLMQKYSKLMQGMEGKNLEEMLTTYLNTINKVLEKTREVEKAYQAVRKMAESSLQNVGMVRYNAFPDTGSDLSFAIALLDHHGDGIVINSLFGRSETRTYGKPIQNGASVYHLSAEEQEAIRIALAGKKESGPGRKQ